MPPGESALPFTDARSCKAWLSGLPLTNIPQAQQQVQEALDALTDAALDGLEKLKCLELMRDRVAFLQGEQRSRYLGRPLPLPNAEERAWQSSLALLQSMEAAYRRVLDEAIGSPTELHRHAALVAQRAVRLQGAQIALHTTVYRRFDPVLWERLHATYAQAEAAGVAEERVKDSLDGSEGASSVAEAYARVLLLEAARPYELSPGQADFVDAIARTWARKATLRRADSEETLPPTWHPLVVDLDRAAGASPLPPREVTARHRVLETMAISSSIRRRIQGLRAGEDVAQLKLPVQAAGLDVTALLERLHRAWCEATPRPASRPADVAGADLVMGLPGIYYFVADGQPFEPPNREITSQEKQDIEVFGRVSSRTQQLRQADFTVAKSDSWAVVGEQMGAWRLRRREKVTQGVALGRLVAMRLSAASPFFLGWIQELVQERDGELAITVALFPGKPEPVPVRPDPRARSGGKWQEGFRLPAMPKLNVPASLVVPSGVALRGRGVEAWEGGAQLLKCVAVLERGSDFDRVALDPP